jgi:hypothetical protein
LHDVARLMRKRRVECAISACRACSATVLAHLSRHEGIQQGSPPRSWRSSRSPDRILDRLEAGLVGEAPIPPTAASGCCGSQAERTRAERNLTIGAITRSEALDGVARPNAIACSQSSLA